MSNVPNSTPPTVGNKAAEVEAAARAQADLHLQDDAQARAKGKAPEQIEARRRVAALFLQCHWPGEKPEAVQAALEHIDYTQTVSTTNGRQVNMDKPKGSGFLGMGVKPQYLMSKAFVPKTDADPIYVLEYFPRQ